MKSYTKLSKVFKYLNVFSCTYTHTSMFLINKNEVLIKLKKENILGDNFSYR